ncbi:hypothetical protein NE619_13640 [Anaerovorax odorimutans]|uniref:Lipoprotein n=1 Tax=Anaerovorax odorimutans TaxID=109327 RepID=A0ABT1RRF3_9FIRM|nr:hypothetical protein [Anaerovorax odorimutans]MCQ4637772.1 hypothetical protein [Anaerovorax odorimutans]
MKKSFLCLSLILMMCLSFAACGTSQSKEKADETAALETTQAPVKEKVFKTSDERFQITANEDWSDAKDVLDIEDATLSIAKNAEGYIALISENKYNFSEKLSGYNKMVVKNMGKNIDEEKTSKSQEMKLGSYNAYKTMIAGKIDDVDQVYQIYCAEINDRYVQLVCWSLEGNQKKLTEEFDKIAQTLSPVKD